MSIGVYDVSAFLFLVGCLSFIVGALLNVRFWFSGRDSIFEVIQTSLKTIFSKKIIPLAKGMIVYLLGKQRLSRSGKVRGAEKSIFIIFYAVLILVNHYYVDIIGESANLLDVIKNFFYSPYVPAYIFGVQNWQNLSWIKTFFFVDNLSMFMVVCFAEFMLIVRRFYEKYYTISTLGDKVLIFMPIMWLILRMFAEAASLIYFNVSSVYYPYLFIAYVFTFILNPLVQIFGAYTLYALFWLSSGIAFMLLVAVWPYTKLWHAFSGSLSILINSAEGET
jgi:hypothetical protein